MLLSTTTLQLSIFYGKRYSLFIFEKNMQLLNNQVILRNGYLSYLRTRNGKSRFHEMKLKEIRDRKNM